MKWLALAILSMLIASPAFAEIGGGFFYVPDPVDVRRHAAENEARILRDLADCKAGRESGSVCHGYCRGNAYRFDRARFCDRWGNFRIQAKAD